MHKILIADADPETREWYTWLVHSMGHIPLACEDGIALLDCSAANPDIDLILMDMDLPGAWGEQLLSVIKKQEGLRHVPILVTSSPRSHADLMRILASGATRWFERPPEELVLVDAIEEALQTGRFVAGMKTPNQVELSNSPVDGWLWTHNPDLAPNLQAPYLVQAA